LQSHDIPDPATDGDRLGSFDRTNDLEVHGAVYLSGLCRIKKNGVLEFGGCETVSTAVDAGPAMRRGRGPPFRTFLKNQTGVPRGTPVRVRG
jgi:hypothetical protein